MTLHTMPTIDDKSTINILDVSMISLTSQYDAGK